MNTFVHKKITYTCKLFLKVEFLSHNAGDFNFALILLYCVSKPHATHLLKYLLNTYHVPGTTIDTKNLSMDKYI